MDIAAVLSIAASAWISLPHGDTVWELLETTVPFTFTEPMNTGGTLTGVPSHVGSEASSWTQATYRIGLVDVTDMARGGVPLIYPDLSLVEQVKVSEAAGPLEAGPPGPAITLVPRAGGDAWSGDVAYVAAPRGFQAVGPVSPPPIARLRSLARVEVTGGGPVSVAGPRLFLSGVRTRSSHKERDEPFFLPGDAASLFARGTQRLSTSQIADAHAWMQTTRSAFGGRARFADRNLPVRQEFGGAVARWTWDARVPVEIEGGPQSTRISPEADVDAPHATIERLVDGPVDQLVGDTRGTRQRWSLAASATPSPIGRHALRAAASVSVASMHAAPLGSGFIGETVNGLPARAWQYGYAGETGHRETMAALHLSDTIRLRWLTLDGGVGVEHVDTPGVAGVNRVSWTTVDPRLALDLMHRGWTLTVAARRYHVQLPLQTLAFGDPASPQGEIFRWSDGNGDRRVQPGEVGTLLARAGPGSAIPGFSSIDAGLRRPYTDELFVGIERPLDAHWTLRFSGVTRREREFLAALNLGVPASSYTVTHIFDPGLDLGGTQDDQELPIYRRSPATFGRDRYLLTNDDGHTGTYGGLYFSLSSTAYQNARLGVAGTMLRSNAPAAYRGFRPQENDHILIGDAFSDPNSTTFAPGRRLFDRGYGLKVWGSYLGPRGITLGTAARYADGQNFARVVVVPDLPQGPDVVRAYANGKSKFTFTLTLDVRASKAFYFRGSQIVTALEGFNVLNTRNEVEEDATTGPRWRMPTAVQPPRVIRAVLRIGL